MSFIQILVVIILPPSALASIVSGTLYSLSRHVRGGSSEYNSKSHQKSKKRDAIYGWIFFVSCVLLFSCYIAYLIDSNL